MLIGSNETVICWIRDGIFNADALIEPGLIKEVIIFFTEDDQITVAMFYFANLWFPYIFPEIIVFQGFIPLNFIRKSLIKCLKKSC